MNFLEVLFGSHAEDSTDSNSSRSVKESMLKFVSRADTASDVRYLPETRCRFASISIEHSGHVLFFDWYPRCGYIRSLRFDGIDIPSGRSAIASACHEKARSFREAEILKITDWDSNTREAKH